MPSPHIRRLDIPTSFTRREPSPLAERSAPAADARSRSAIDFAQPQGPILAFEHHSGAPRDLKRESPLWLRDGAHAHSE